MNKLKIFSCTSVLITASALFAIKTGQTAPGGFFLRNLSNGKTELMRDYFNKGPVMLSFWASYCVPCAKEMPQLQDLMSKHSNVRLVFINIDSKNKLSLVKKLVGKWGVTQTVLLDQYQVAAKKYIPKLAVPATFLIGSDGYIKYSSLGYKKTTITGLKKSLKKLQ